MKTRSKLLYIYICENNYPSIQREVGRCRFNNIVRLYWKDVRAIDECYTVICLNVDDD